MKYIIGNHFFKKHSRNDTQFTVLEGATVIVEKAILSSDNLTQITIQEGATEIKGCALEGCTSLTNQPTLEHQLNRFSSMKTGNTP